MSRKHYRAIAKIIAEMNRDFYSTTMIDNMAKEMASYFKGDNSAFNRTKFLEACGVGA